MRARTVVIVPGLGSTPGEWDDVVDALSAEVAVLVVDPADAPPLRTRTDWTPQAVAARLAERLIGTARPVLLVGHSSGGLHVQAALYAGDGHADAGIAGALLVDASHESAVRLAPAALGAVGRAVADVVLATGISTLLGPAVRRLGVRAASTRRRDRLTPAAVRTVYSSRAWVRTTVDAWFGHGPLQAGVLAWQRERGAPTPPVRLLVGAAGSGRGRARWIATQRDLAARLGAPEPRLLDDAGHLVALDRPDAVVTEVRALLADS
ncbi:alpha/beta hydrolase [Actinomycetospora corticicola]|uniref:Pimeloyl-ACP methyl ester carboxylesterase n=1 Tax=Actinomycetospora corticicola TaxID=663602 RepID=A0A7Y9E204_9PSEU|nr:pimeloyl-ACP methyl ester carboxylesterase [Actinomycetospora corticicola]